MISDLNLYAIEQDMRLSGVQLIDFVCTVF